MSGVDAGIVEGLAVGLFGAAVFGGVIGIQRQITRKAAGFRTHLLVAVGSCAFTEVSRLAGDTRIAAGVITGIGFLGAGAIVREGAIPRGLTTAASIWCAAAVGVAMGFGVPYGYILGGLTTVVVLAALVSSDSYLDRFFPARNSHDVCITFDADALSLDDVRALFAANGLHVSKSIRLAVEREELRRYARWQVSLKAKHDVRLRSAVIELSKNAAIRAVDAEGTPAQ